MANDIYNRATDAYGGSFSADGALVTFTSGLGAELALTEDAQLATVGLLTQNLSLSYQQNILRLYEIGSAYHFLVAGRTQGQAALNRVLGPRRVSLAFYNKYGDVCNAGTNIIDLTFTAGCTAGVAASSTVGLQARYCVINNLGVTMNSQDSLISESLSLMYCSLLMAIADF